MAALCQFISYKFSYGYYPLNWKCPFIGFILRKFSSAEGRRVSGDTIRPRAFELNSGTAAEPPPAGRLLEMTIFQSNGADTIKT